MRDVTQAGAGRERDWSRGPTRTSQTLTDPVDYLQYGAQPSHAVSDTRSEERSFEIGAARRQRAEWDEIPGLGLIAAAQLHVAPQDVSLLNEQLAAHMHALCGTTPTCVYLSA